VKHGTGIVVGKFDNEEECLRIISLLKKRVFYQFLDIHRILRGFKSRKRLSFGNL